MNGTGNGKVQTNSHIITIVVVGLVFNATLGMCTLAYCMVAEKKIDVALFTAFVAILNYIFGIVSGMLIKSSPTATTSNSSEQPKPADKTGEVHLPPNS